MSTKSPQLLPMKLLVQDHIWLEASEALLS